MITNFLRSQTFASLPNLRLNTPMVPRPHTSCVMRTSAFTQILSPACTLGLPAARARIFSVNVINPETVPEQGSDFNPEESELVGRADSILEGSLQSYVRTGVLGSSLPSEAGG